MKYRTTIKYLLGALFLGLILVPQVRAETTYQYSGNPLEVRHENYPVGSSGSYVVPAGSYEDCGNGTEFVPCKVTGSFTVAEPLGFMIDYDISDLVTHFEFSDGRATLLYWNDPDLDPNPVDPEHFAVVIDAFNIWTDPSPPHQITGWSIYVKHDVYTPQSNSRSFWEAEASYQYE